MPIGIAPTIQYQKSDWKITSGLRMITAHLKPCASESNFPAG